MKFTLLIILISICSCNRIKKKTNKVISDSKEIISDKISNVLELKFESTATNFHKEIPTSTEITTFDIDGIKISKLNYYYSFLKYKGDISKIMDFIEGLKTSKPNFSDLKFTETDNSEIKNSIQFIINEDQLYIDKLDFFIDSDDAENIEFYKCNKYPLSHHIAYDTVNQIIYHHIYNYLD